MSMLQVAGLLFVIALVLFAFIVARAPHCCARCEREIRPGSDLCHRCAMEEKAKKLAMLDGWME